MRAANPIPPRNAVEAVTHADPYSYYAGLRATRPMFFDESLSLWVVSDAAGVTQTLANPHLRVRPPVEPVPKALLGRPAGEVFSRLVRMNDGDFHARHRPAVAASAQRWNDEAVASAAQSAAENLSGRLHPNELLTALPVQAMARLLGVNDDSLDATTANVLAFTKGIGPGADAQALTRADEAATTLMADGERQGLDSVRAANRIALMQQSVDATAALLGNCVLATRTQASHWNPQGALPFVAECARWDAPVHNTRRFAAQDTELAGAKLREGQGVLVVLASANRDPALNPEPDRFLLDRPNRRSLGFGSGAHACPGEALAIRIAAAALPLLLSGSRQANFGECTGFRPLPNARIPIFSD